MASMASYEDMISPQLENRENFIVDNSHNFEHPEDDADMDLSGFFDNIVTDIDIEELDIMSRDIMDQVNDDRHSRQAKDERYAQALKRLGFSSQDIIGGAEFDGASEVVHNGLAVACIEFSSRASKELITANGCVKSKIVGEATQEKIDIAERKRNFLNFLLTEKLPYRTQMEAMLSQLPLAGSQFMKVWWDNDYNEAKIAFIPIDFLYIPAYCDDFYTANRITQRIEMNVFQFQKNLRDGLYSKHHYTHSKLMNSEDGEGNADNKTLGYYGKSERYAGDDLESMVSMAQSVAERIDGLNTNTNSGNATAQENQRQVFEIHCDYEIPDDKLTGGEVAPYIITIDLKYESILSIQRNWNPDDELRRRKHNFVEYKFLPWRGAYGIGYAELFDGASAAQTGALRALMDASLLANFPTILKSKGSGMAGQTNTPSPGQLTEVETGNMPDSDLRKMIMPLAMATPQPVLMNLMQYLDGQMTNMSTTVQDMLKNAGDDVSATMTLAMVEEGSKKQAAIMGRLHDSNHKFLKILSDILKDNLDESMVVEELGEEIIYRADFDRNFDIIPVSDPNVFSEYQRFAQLQMVMQMAGTNPQLYNLPEVHRRALDLIHIAEPDRLLNAPQDMGKLNPIAENINLMNSVAIMAFSDQNHMAHIKAHIEFLSNPMLGSNPMFAQQMQAMQPHIQQHISYLYAQAFKEAQLKNGQDVDIAGEEGVPQIDKELSEMNGAVLASVTELLTPFQQPLQQAIQTIQKNLPPPQQDPAILKIQAEQEETKRKAAKDQMDNEIEKLKIAEDKQYDDTILEIEKLKAQMKQAELRLKASSEASKAKTEGVKTVLAAAQMTSNLDIAKTKLRSEEARNHRAHHIAQQQVDAAKSKPVSGGHHGKN